MGDISSVTSGQLVFQMMLAVVTIAVIIFWLGAIIRNSVKKMVLASIAVGITLIIRNFLGIIDVCLRFSNLDSSPVVFISTFCQLIVAGGLTFISFYILISYKSATVWKPAFIIVPVTFAVVTGISVVISVFLSSDLWICVGTSLYSLIVIAYCSVSFALGLIPNNRMLRIIFEHSTLKMQIIDSSGTRFVLSKNAKKPDEKVLKKLLCGTSTIMTDENTILISKRSGKNFVVWEQDVSGINAIRRETSELVRSLVETNRILSEREEREKKVETKRVASVISSELENRLKGKLDELSMLSDRLVSAEDASSCLPEIALLLCYIKRSVNFYFLSREKDLMEYDEYTVFVDELCEIAGYSGVKVMNINMVEGVMPIRIASLGYEFMYELLCFLIKSGVNHALIRMMNDNGSNYMRIIPSKRVIVDEMHPQLLESIRKMHFAIDESYTEDMFMISFHVENDYMEQTGYTPEEGRGKE